ncbi:MAG: hypothetical protein OXG82_22725 [Gammaproteobacteria bacterium]|nr:hypothetical protein [Gammaproteobacteria bacterium]
MIIILGAWATMSAHAVMNLSGGTHAPAVYAAETVSTKAFTSLVATNTTFNVTAWSDVNLAGGSAYHFRYDLSGGTGSAVFGNGIMFQIGTDTAVEAARARRTDLVFTATPSAQIDRSVAPTPPATMPTAGTNLVLMLDGAHPPNEATPADLTDVLPSAVRAARVFVKGAASDGTYKFMLRLRIYGDLAGALSGGDSTLYDSGMTPIIAIDPTLSAKVKASADLVADVAHNFTRFQGGENNEGMTSGKLATVTVGLKDTHCSGYTGTTCNHTPWPIMPAGADADGMMIELGDVMGSGTLTVHGDHSLVDLKLGTRGLTLRDALTKALEKHTEGDNKGQYKDRGDAVDAHITLNAAGDMDLTANVGDKNTDAIPAGSYAATIALTPANSDAAAVGGVEAADAGTIVTNGTMVHLGYLTGHDGYNQRVIIVNRGKVDANYVVGNILTEDGTEASAGHMATGTVGGESQMVIPTADMISFDSGRTRASATISLTAPTSAISVSTTIVNLSDGSTDTSAHMVQ